MEIEEILEQIGLDENEAKIYLAVLSLDDSTVLPISKKAGIGRTYCYDILDSLVLKGLVSYVEKRGRRRYSAVPPKMIKKMLNDRMKQFEAVLPDLESLHQKSPMKPRVRFFEGKEGVATLYEEVLQEAKEAWFLGSISDWSKRFPDYVSYVKKQVAKGIKIHELVKNQDKDLLDYQKFFKKGVQETRLLPEKAIFNTDNMLWNNKFVMISYGADIYAVSVESAEIAQTMRVIYEMLWEKAQKLD